jgi:multicomponent Na+:H+ antiporter subunit G
MISAVLDVAAAVLLFGGLGLATIGLYGLLRKPDIFHQLHAAGLVTGPALLLVLLAAIGTGNAEIITSAALVFVFLLVTSSLSNHAIAHAARQAGSRAGRGEAERGPRSSPSS